MADSYFTWAGRLFDPARIPEKPEALGEWLAAREAAAGKVRAVVGARRHHARHGGAAAAGIRRW